MTKNVRCKEVRSYESFFLFEAMLKSDFKADDPIDLIHKSPGNDDDFLRQKQLLFKNYESPLSFHCV